MTGRPDDLLRSEVLEPQLRFELHALLPWYVRLEKVLLVEYSRMGLLDAPQVAALTARLDGATPEAVGEAAREAMSDLACALERHVGQGLDELPPAWHVDGGRNDLRAGAQLLYGRARLLDSASLLLDFGRAAHRLASRSTELMMPGYTHLQAAEPISPGFYLAALCEQVEHTLSRLESVYVTASTSPLGAGAMAGQQLAWDRERMARLLGCERVQRHALRAVGQRDWALEACAEFSLLGVALSRFATDLMTWSGTGHGFIHLPAAWSGVSPAMPQKKNFPVLERIRGRTAQLGAAYAAISTGQRNTPYSHSFEVSEEASAQVPAAFDTLDSVLRLFTSVLENLSFREDRLREACEAEHFGAGTLANLLTLRTGVPWRAAQAVAGRYIAAAEEAGLPPAAPDAALFEQLLAEHGLRVPGAGALLHEAMDVRSGLTAKRTTGSTAPDAVGHLLAAQGAEFERLALLWSGRRRRIRKAAAELDGELTAITERPTRPTRRDPGR
ncbi:argininosuccinate lyase [Streptomyces sp. N2-109]|uniref:argininosuccinate lyase n=1 Tax=Streptomyces gossypii TaxID=2883101 RepID=A0ABT2JV24_9ACTN|nr:lyase family protein [Streptomyces gossypii]MCT2591749.1 argininosuccinate lyase [Streptomyces gossypii]